MMTELSDTVIFVALEKSGRVSGCGMIRISLRISAIEDSTELLDKSVKEICKYVPAFSQKAGQEGNVLLVGLGVVEGFE